jgi:hypothetical protein
LEYKTRDRIRTSPEYKKMREEKDQLQRKLLFLGFFTEKLKEKDVNAVIVGGEAIDIYTGGTFASADIDLLVQSKIIPEKLLNKFGFEKKSNMLWLNKELAIVMHIIESMYSGDFDKLKKMKIGKYELQIASPEYLIKDRLCSLKFWKDNPQSDMEKTVTLLKIFFDSIDNSYLDQLAKENDIEDVLAEARRYALTV